jgi:hypothetical protein
MKKLAVVCSMIVTVLCASLTVEAQKVRLRSKITPNCGSTSQLKYADIWADGNIAVMGTYNCRGAFIFDVSNPDAPTLSNWYNPSPNQSFLEAIVIGNRGYFGSGGQGPTSPTTGDGVHIVDLTDPASPVLLGKVNSTSGNGFNGIHEMVVFDQGGRRFLIENYNSFSNKLLKVIDVTDPAAPVFIRDIDPTEISWVHAVHIRGNRMYTSGWGTGSVRGRTEIYDISNLATQAPTLLGYIEDSNASITNGNNMHSSWTSEDGNFLYSAREVTNSNGSSPGDVRVYDVSNPATPLLVDRVTMSDLDLNAVTPHNPVVMGDKLYVSWYQAGVQVFDISTPGDLERIGQYDTYPPAFREDQTKKSKSLSDEPWDIICGRDSLQNTLPTSYNGTWAVFPFLGEDKVLVGEMNDGLLVVDASKVTAPPRNVVSDFDGDGKTDLSRFSPANGFWTIERSSDRSQFGFPWGLPTDVIVPADYDGDGKSDVAIWRPTDGVWWIAGSSGVTRVVQFGLAGDIPVSGDFDADGRSDLAVWRPSNGYWYIWQSTLGFKFIQWGSKGDKPITGDWDGDGKSDMAVFRPSQGIWYVFPSATSIPLYVYWGLNGDRPVSGDFNGDGRSEFTVFRPSNGVWYMYDAATDGFFGVQWGIAEDIPVAGDYDGDEKADVSVYRPSQGIWYRLNSSDISFSGFRFGQAGDKPSPASVNPQ